MGFSINGKPFKNPGAGFKVERFNITNLERNAAGLMCGDLIAKKMKFSFTYDAISAKDLDNILDLIWDTNEIFFTLTYDYQGQQKQCVVYSGSIPADLHRAGRTTNWVWKGVTFDLIER